MSGILGKELRSAYFFSSSCPPQIYACMHFPQIQKCVPPYSLVESKRCGLYLKIKREKGSGQRQQAGGEPMSAGRELGLSSRHRSELFKMTDDLTENTQPNGSGGVQHGLENLPQKLDQYQSMSAKKHLCKVDTYCEAAYLFGSKCIFKCKIQLLKNMKSNRFCYSQQKKKCSTINYKLKESDTPTLRGKGP